MLERGQIDKGLDRRARLPLGLRRAVELADLKAEAAAHRQHPPGMRVHRDDCAGNLGDLAKIVERARPRRRLRRRLRDAGFGALLQRLDENEIARLRDIGSVARQAAERPVIVERPRPAHLRERNAPGLAVLQPDLGAVIIGAQYDRELPASGRSARRQRFGREPGRPVRAGIDMADGAAPAAMTAVIGDQPVAQGLVGRRLQFAIHARADRETRLVESFLAIAGEQLAPHLFREIGAIDDFRLFALARGDRFGPGRLDFLFGRGAVLGDPIEHPVAASLRLLRITAGIVIVGRLRQPGEERRLAEGQFVERFVEVDQRRRLDPVGTRAEINLVQVQLEDAVFGKRLLDPGRQQDLLDLARHCQLVGQQHVLGNLLRDRRGADRPALAVPAPEIGQRGPEHRDRVDPAMAVEVLVLGRQKGLDDLLGDRADRHKNPALGRILGQQPPVAGMHPRRNRRLIMRQLLVIGQVAPEIPNRQPDHGATADGEQNKANKENANELNDDAQQRILPCRWRGPPPVGGASYAPTLWPFQGRFG